MGRSPMTRLKFSQWRPRTRRTIGAVLTMLAASLLTAVVLPLRGCGNKHRRPHGHVDVGFDVSPRGDTIVFNAVGEGGRDLYLLDMSTFRTARIAKTPEYEVDPKFSPNGREIVYAAGRPGDRADHIFVRSIDGLTVRQLTTDDANDEKPTFSRDGSLIAFTRAKTYSWGGLADNWAGGVICVIGADGTGFREVTKDESVSMDPHFSADGKTILFCSIDGIKTVATIGSQPPTPISGLIGQQ